MIYTIQINTAEPRIDHIAGYIMRRFLWLLFVWTVQLLFCASQELQYSGYHEEHMKAMLGYDDSSKSVLLPFNRTRVPGSDGSADIRKYIKGFFRDLESEESYWRMEEDTFTENGHEFTNLVFTLGNEGLAVGNSSRYTVFAAHYDTLIKPEGFIGAFDSGASCGILLYLAKFLSHAYAQDVQNPDQPMHSEGMVYKIVFFDGEEAFNNWGPEDSTYGSRRLAAQWEQEGIFDQIDVFVLLDLLGSDTPSPVYSFFAESHEFYHLLSDSESTWGAYRRDHEHILGPHRVSFLDPHDHKMLMHERRGVLIDDDHTPFVERGLRRILHLIPYPFPPEWHTIDDTFEHVDPDYVRHWAGLLSQFALDVIEY